MEKSTRLPEVDAARGVAVIGMVAFNYAYALTYLGKADFPVSQGVLWWFARLVAFLFVFLAGISMWLSYNRVKTAGNTKLGTKFLLRGIWIFFLGQVITLATWFYNPTFTIWFGILHLLGIATLLAYPIIKTDGKKLALLAFAITLCGIYLSNKAFDFPHLLWLGFWPVGYSTFDYFPLLPWFGFFLLGIAVSKFKYPKMDSAIKSAIPANPALMPIIYLGRHSLIIYLIHQPLLLLFLFLIGA